MKLGGYDFIKKPFELEEIVAAVRNAARTRSLEQRVAYMAAQERKRTRRRGVRARRARAWPRFCARCSRSPRAPCRWCS